MPTLHPLDPEHIPTAIRAGLDRYANLGVMPSDCLRAILAGDLFAAFARADADTVVALPAIVSFIVNKLRAPYGSYQKVNDHVARHAELARQRGQADR